MIQHLTLPDGRQISYIATQPATQAATQERPGLLWLNGFRSDMSGSKVTALAEWAAENGLAMTRFDYSGHGQSPGDLATGTIGGWLDEAWAVFTQVTQGPQILVGSSMGGYLALLMARKHVENLAPEEKSRIAGMVLIAPAVNMTEDLIWAELDHHQREALQKEGRIYLPSEYDDEPLLITWALIEDGRKHLLQYGFPKIGCPIHILHGMEDPDVRCSHSINLMEMLQDQDVVMTLVKDGEHRMSRPQDIRRLLRIVANMVTDVSGLAVPAP